MFGRDPDRNKAGVSSFVFAQGIPQLGEAKVFFQDADERLEKWKGDGVLENDAKGFIFIRVVNEHLVLFINDPLADRRLDFYNRLGGRDIINPSGQNLFLVLLGEDAFKIDGDGPDDLAAGIYDGPKN